MPTTPVPPIAERRPVQVEHHGVVRHDDYAWLRDREDPATLRYLEAENAYLEETLGDVADLRQELYREILGRVQQTDRSVPYGRGPWWYLERTVEGADYVVHCRAPRHPGQPVPTHTEQLDGEVVVFDENAEAAGAPFFQVGNLSVSPDHGFLAYATETAGDERYTLKFRDLTTGVDAPEAIVDTGYGLVWANDSATVFYTRVDDAWRTFQLWRHRVGQDPAGDELVFQEDDERFSLGVGRSRDGRAIVIHLASKMTSECHLLDPDDPEAAPVLVEPRQPGIEYHVDHHRGAIDYLVALRNVAGADFALEVRPRAGGNWQVVIPHRPGVRLDDVDCFAQYLVVTERLDGDARLRILPLSEGPDRFHDAFERSWLLPTSAPPSTSWLGENAEFDASVLRCGETSLVTPPTQLDVDLATGARQVLKVQEVLGGYDPARYATTRLLAPAADGAEIPISLVWRRDLAGPANGPSALLLYGYGSYEHSMDPTFRSTRLSLLDRGVVYAIAHVRGGGEGGRAWYEQGRLEHKATTFTDFVSCAAFLCQQGWTAPDRLCARGASAGGLLMGAVANLAPQQFCAIVAEVPFVDCLSTMLDASLPLTIGEYEEWGNPEADPAAFATIASYAPYEQVASTEGDGRPRTYPQLLVTAGLNDTRVGYWEPAKWVAKLRAANPANEVLLRTELGAGHGGPSGRYDAWADEALVYAFLLRALSRRGWHSPARS